VTFRDKAINVIYKAATSSKRVRTPLTPIGAIFFFLLTALFVVLSLQVDRLLKFPNLISEPLNSALSVPVLSVGLLIYLWTVLHFLKGKGTPVPFNPPPKVVTTGPYAYCRNPMLTSVFILLFGLSIQFRSVSLFFIFTPLYILLNVLELKAIEEPELAKRLGKEYLEYKESTPMFIPRLRARSEEK
jgi:protein-S-isoprenylcysteine O-methyltransferase Ste14